MYLKECEFRYNCRNDNIYKSDYPLQIEIVASDLVDLSQTLPKRIIYNFPPEHVRSGEIELAEQLPRSVDIKIEPLNLVLTP